MYHKKSASFDKGDQTPSDSDDALKEGLKLLKQCPICKLGYEQSDMKVIDESDEAFYVHVRCQKCENAVVAVMVISPLGMSSVGVLTDLTDEDCARCYAYEPISQDDVLDFHEWLRYDGAAFMHCVINK